MSILFGIWLVSLVTILGIVTYGWILYRRSFHAQVHTPLRLHDIFTHEVSQMHKDFYKLLAHMRPHGVRTARAGLVMIKRGQELFIHRVYGRMKIEKGSASSFFLKHITEHKVHSKREHM